MRHKPARQLPQQGELPQVAQTVHALFVQVLPDWH